MFVKSSKRQFLRGCCMINLESNLQGSMLFPSSTPVTLFPSHASPSHLPSQSPSTLTIFRTNERVQIDVHTRAQSTFLLGQAMMTCFEGRGLSPGNDQLALRT